MVTSSAKFEEKKWWYDKEVFKDGFKDFILLTDYAIDCQPIIGLSKDKIARNSLCTIGIRWVIYIMHLKKEIVEYEFEDNYWANIEHRANESDSMDIIINDSIQRLKDHYNNRKEEIGIKSSIPDFSNQYRIDLRKRLMEHLETRLKEPLP